MPNEVAVGSCNVGESPFLFWRAQINVSGTVTDLLQAHLSSMTYTVWNRGVQVGDEGSLTVSSAVHDTLQTGTAWTEALGDDGGNVEMQLPSSYLTTAGQNYAVDVKATLTSGKLFYLKGRITTLSRTV